jgi:outer membrane protein OmpA-like peptidoglycan-associated protein
MWRRVLALGLMVGLNACGLPSNVVVLIPDEAGTVGRISVERDHAKDELSVPYTAEETDAGGKALGVFATDEKTVDAAFSGALAGTPRKPVIYVIFFLNGQTVLEPRSVDTLNATITAARTTQFADISVVGHSDSVGNDDTNLVLSMFRAQTIRAALVSGGVSPSVIDVGYHGANNPRVPWPRGVPEPENRRVEVTIR